MLVKLSANLFEEVRNWKSVSEDTNLVVAVVHCSHAV